jgi:exopolysaccharide biosynthesis protein
MNCVKMLVAACTLAVACVNAHADDATMDGSGVTQSGFSPLYLGVDTETATVPSNPAKAGGPATISHAYVMRVDLYAPGVSLTATEHSGPLQTMSETISQFAARKKVRLAINANFFAPCCNTAAEPKTVIGLLVSEGHVVSPPTFDPTQSEAVLAVSRGNLARIAQAPEIRLPFVETAVAGSAIIVKDGRDVSGESPNEGDPLNPNPRTLVGLSHEGRYLYLVTIDGRVTGYSTGTTNAQSAALMQAIGATDAINLDGGGSTELVRADVPGQPFIVNNVSGGVERYDASALGVYARDLPHVPFLPHFPF